jgi:hypothetical protein
MNTIPNTGATITGATVKKQLNGNTLYILLEGTEQSIMDARDTLYSANALSGEPDFLTGNHDRAVVTTSLEQFKRGLFNREVFHLMDNPEACKANKKHHGGFAAQAEAQAEAIWDSIECVRVISPNDVTVPYTYRMGSNRASEADMSGRD